jgi:hypothetical protein
MSVNLLASNDAYIDCGDIAALGGAANATIAFSIKLTAAPVDQARLIGQWHSSIGNVSWMVYVYGDEVAFLMYDGSWKGNVTTSLNLTNGSLYRIVARKSGTAAAIFVNGVQQAVTNTSGATTGSVATLVNSPQPVRIGRDESPADGQDGDYERIAIWTRALTDDECIAYTSGLTAPEDIEATGRLLYVPATSTSALADQWGSATVTHSNGTTAPELWLTISKTAADAIGVADVASASLNTPGALAVNVNDAITVAESRTTFFRGKVNFICGADGNFTTPGTWMVPSAVHQQLLRSAQTALTTSFVYTASAVIPSGEVVDGVLLLIGRLTNSSSVTLSVAINNGTTDVQTVVINGTDLDSNGVVGSGDQTGWLFIKFAGTVTGDGVTSYRIGLKASAGFHIYAMRSGTASDWTRVLRTSTVNTSAIAAGDNFFVAGEWTAAATVTPRTVTMDNNSATDYGNGTAGSGCFGTGFGGTVNWSTAGNTQLRFSGDIYVGAGSSFNIGTVGTPIPIGTTAILELDCTGDGTFNILVRGIFRAQGSPRTSGKLVIGTRLAADAAATNTVLTVEDDTGWKSGDEVGIAPTGIVNTEYERRTLSGDAGSSSFTITAGLTNAHLGSVATWNRRAGIILLTRNVVLRAVTSTHKTSVTTAGFGVVDVDWVQFKDMGYSGVGALNWASTIPTTGAANVTVNANYCSFDENEGYGFYAGNNVGFSQYMTLQDCGLAATGAGSNGFNPTSSQGAITPAVFQRLWVVRVNGSPFLLQNAAGTISDIYAAGAGGSLVIQPSSQLYMPNGISNIEIHTSDGGLVIGNFVGTTLTNLRAWNTASGSGAGLYLGSSNAIVDGCFFDTGDLFANNARSMYFAFHVRGCVFRNYQFDAGNGFGYNTASGVTFLSSTTTVYFHSAKFINCKFGQRQAHATLDLTRPNGHLGMWDLTFEHCQFSTTPIHGAGFLDTGLTYVHGVEEERWGRLRFHHLGQVAVHRTVVGGRGTLATEATTFRTAAPSEALTPISASYKLRSGLRRVLVTTGQTKTVRAYVYVPTAYNGAAPRLVVRQNASQGVATDTVLDTATPSLDAWELLSGVLPTALVDGVFEVFVDCDGTAGSVYVDDWSVT